MNNRTINNEITKAVRELTANRNEILTKTISIKLVDFWNDKDEPAIDLEIYIDGEPLTGGTGVFSANKYKNKQEAINKAKKAIDEIVKTVEKFNDKKW